MVPGFNLPRSCAAAVLAACLFVPAARAAQDGPQPPPEPVGPVPVDMEAPAEPPAAPAPVDVPVPVAPVAPPTLTGSAKDAWTVRAQRAQLDSATGALVVEGDVVVEGPGRAMGAERVEVDTRAGTLRAVGPAVMADGRMVATCADARVDLRAGTGTLRRVVIHVHAPMDAATRAEVARLRRAPALPRSAMARASSVEVKGGGRFELKGAFITTCDCVEGTEPPLSVTAARADVLAGERATVWAPIFRIKGIPVAAAPVWIVPLKPRLSGLLFPQVRIQDGLWVQQPAYVTLGDSADLTLAPGVVTERGPRLSAEARAAPREGTYVETQLTYQRDAKHLWARRDPARDVDPTGGHVPWRDLTGTKRSYTRTGELLRPDRFAGRMVARSTVGPLALAADVNLVSDRFVPGDFGASLGERVAPYLRSGAATQFAFRHVSLAAALAAFQDLQQPDVLLWGPASARMAHRIPLVRLTLQEMPLLPAWGSMGSPLAVRVQGGMDQELVLGTGATREPWAVPGRISGATRLYVQPELVVPLRFSRFGGLRSSVGVRETVLLGPRARLVDVTRVYARNRAETEVTGTFLPGRRLMHRVRPYVAHDGVVFTRHSGDVSPWMDAWDRVRPYQAVGAGAEQVFTLSRVLGRTWTLRTDLHGAVDLLNLRQAEVRAGAWATTRGMSLSGRVALDPVTRTPTFLQAAMDVGDATTPQVHVGYVRVGRDAPRFLLGGTEELLGGTRLDGPFQLAGADRLDAMLALPVGDARVDYGVEVAFPGWDPVVHPLSSSQRVEPRLITHGGGVTLQGECRCWSAGVRARFWPDRTVPDVGVQFTMNGPDGQLALFR